MASVEFPASTIRKTSAVPNAKARMTKIPSKNNVSYELFAPRETAQVSRLSRLAALTAGPISHGFGEDKTGTTSSGVADEASILQAMSPPGPSSSSNSMPDGGNGNAQTKIALENAIQTSDHLTSLLKHTTSLRLALRASINIAEDISNRHAELIRHSGELSAAADRLQGEQEMLSRHAEEIGMPLKHYDAVDNIGVLVGVLFKGKTVVRGLAKIKVDNDEFPSILDQIDDAVEFFARESGGREALEEEMKRQRSTKGEFETSGSIEYYRRSLALQDAALFLIREAVVDRISTTTAQVSSALDIPKTPIAADKLEASLVYTRFYGISSRSNRLLSFVRKRLHHGEAYHQLLQLCRTTYCNCRDSLLKATIRAHMDKLKDQHGLVGMTRLASVFLIRLCTVETALYLDFFGEKKIEEGKESSDGKEANSENDRKKSSQIKGTLSLPPRTTQEDGTSYDKDFQSYLSSLTSALHRTVRRGLVTVLDLDTLCQIVSVLREERSMASSSPTTLAAARSISSVIEDAQERLIFCATTSLTKEVIRFKASPKDLDYPNKLTKKSETTADAAGGGDDAVKKQLEVYESWFPPMRSVLKILSKIFRVVEPKVFEDIALQSVQSCTRSLRDGSKYIEKKSGTIHADLFLVKHLLILREQLSPFDIDLRAVERQLDFSDAGRAVSRFLANRNRRLFSMSTENALVTLLREGVSVNEESVDSKRDLEEALRNACNAFIDHICNTLATEVFNQSNKFSGLKPESAQGTSGVEANTLKETMASTLENFEPKAKDVLTTMSLYLENPTTQSILLKPVSKKISKALEEIKKGVNKTTDGEDSGWNESIRKEILHIINDLEKAVKKIGRAAK